MNNSSIIARLAIAALPAATPQNLLDNDITTADFIDALLDDCPLTDAMNDDADDLDNTTFDFLLSLDSMMRRNCLAPDLMTAYLARFPSA